MILLHLLGVWMLASNAAAALKIGDTMPVLAGQTVSGKPIELPTANVGSVRVLVISFTKAASTDSQLWTGRVAKENGGAALFRVIMLEAVPKLFRGMAVSGIKSGLPQSLWDTAILSYTDENLWKERLAVTSDKHSYVVLLDGGNRVCWLSIGAFNEDEYAGLRKELLGLRGAGGK